MYSLYIYIYHREREIYTVRSGSDWAEAEDQSGVSLVQVGVRVISIM